jgi:DNA-binding NarL/FixJ family response regulator
MAEGRSNVAIASRLGVSASAVEKHVHAIFQRLGLEPSEHDHRRVRAVVTYLAA